MTNTTVVTVKPIKKNLLRQEQLFINHAIINWGLEKKDYSNEVANHNLAMKAFRFYELDSDMSEQQALDYLQERINVIEKYEAKGVI